MSVIARVQMCRRGWPGVIEDSLRKAERGRGWARGLWGWAMEQRGQERLQTERADQEGPVEEDSGCEPGLPALTWASAGT